MNISDLNVLTATALVRASANTATVTSAAFDLSQYIGVLKVSQYVGAVAGTNSPTLAGGFQDSADGITYAPVAAYAFAPVTAANTDQSIQVDTRACRRYLQYVGTISGTTPSFTIHVDAIGEKKVK